MLLFADSFEHYGTSPAGGRTAMLAGEWLEISNTSISVSASLARTGSHSLLMSVASTGERHARRSLKGPKTEFGIGWGMYYDDNLPTRPDSQGVQIRDSNNQAIASILFNPDGSFNIRRGNRTGPLVGVTDIVISAQAYNYVEAKFVIDEIVGYIEIRVNGAVEFIISDVNLGTVPATNVSYMQRTQVSGDTGSFPTLRWDDLVAWDTQGDHNNDFLGPVRVITQFADGGTEVASWTRVGAASDVDAIDEVPADGDTSYLGADDANVRSEFTLPELPPEVVAVRGIYVPAMARIEDAGIGNIKIDFVSNGEVTDSDAIPLTPFYTYRGTAIQANPDGDVEWTKEAYEAARIRIEKTE